MKYRLCTRWAGRFVAAALACGVFACLGAGTAFAASAVQTDATVSTITCEFSSMPDNCTVTMGNVEIFDTSQDKTSIIMPADNIQELTSERAVFTGLPSGSSSYCFKFNYHYVNNSSGFSGDGTVTLLNPVTVADKASGLKITGQYSSSKLLYFSFKNPGNYFGYEVKLTGNDGKTKTLKYDFNGIVSNSSEIVQTSSLKTAVNQVYKAQVRTYVKVGKNKAVKKYSEWSDTTLLVPQPSLGGKKYSTYAKATWNKIKGAKNYTVYASTKAEKGYKKVTTTSKTSCTIKKVAGKKMKANKAYYYYVVAHAKAGGKTYSSPFIYYSRSY